MRTICLARCGFANDDLRRFPQGEPPRCPACGDWLRPGVVWFGEMLDPDVLHQAQAARRALRRHAGRWHVRSGVSRRGLPAEALTPRRKVIVVNPQACELDALATVVMPWDGGGRAAEASGRRCRHPDPLH